MPETGEESFFGRILGPIKGKVDTATNKSKAPQTPEELKQRVVGILERYAGKIERHRDSTKTGFHELNEAVEAYLVASIDFKNIQTVLDARGELLEASAPALDRMKPFAKSSITADNITWRFGGADLLPAEDRLKSELGKFLISSYGNSWLTPGVDSNIFQKKAQEVGLDETLEILSSSAPGVDLVARTNEWLDIERKIIDLKTQFPEKDVVLDGYKHESVREMPANVKERFDGLEKSGKEYFVTLGDDFINAQKGSSSS